MDRRRVRRQHHRLRRQPGAALVRGFLPNRVHHLRRRTGRLTASVERRRAVRGRVRVVRQRRVRVLRHGTTRGLLDNGGTILRRTRRRAGYARAAVQPRRVHRRVGRETRGYQRPSRDLRGVVRAVRTWRHAHLRSPPVLGSVSQAADVSTRPAGSEQQRRRPRRRRRVPDVVQSPGDLTVQGRVRGDRYPGLLRDALWSSDRDEQGRGVENARAARGGRRRRTRHHRLGRRLHLIVHRKHSHIIRYPTKY
mmetsp:Transcript_7224/g.32599  ORF Transcript_7224/g.32599 Transcript_7224/m.32599 type:complete len:251 (+) Transcript_7224:902-1654(+)